MLKFDDILVAIGEFGPYQRFQYFLICLTALTCASQTFISVYLLATPKFRCRLPTEIWSNDTFAIQSAEHEALIEKYIPMATKTTYETCKMFNSSVDMEDIAVTFRNETETKCYNGWVYDKTEFTDTFITEFNIVCGDQLWNFIITQSYLVGILIGAVVLGWLSDKIGRKLTLMISIGVQLISAFGSAVISDVYSMTLFRFIGGFSVSGLFPVAFVLGMEIVGPSMRTHTGIIIEYVYALGVIILALMAYLIRYWRYLQLGISVIIPFFLTFWWLVPESPRWLYLQSRSAEATKIMQNIAQKNKKELPPDMDEFVERESKPQTNEKESITAICSYPRFMARFANVCYQWFVAAMLYYGLSLNTGQLQGNIYLNSFLSGLVEIPGYMVPHFVLGLMGRRIPHAIAMIVSGLACCCTIVFSLTNNDSSSGVTVLALVGKCFNTAAFGIIYIWTAELLPTNFRNVGIGFASMSGRFGSLLGPVIFQLKSYVGGHLGNGLPLVIFGIFALVAGFMSIVLPETLNRRLPQTLKDTRHDSVVSRGEGDISELVDNFDGNDSAIN